MLLTSIFRPLWAFLLLCFFSVSSFAEPIVITDALKTQHFANSPQRIVVLNWDLLEQVLELGIVPVGAPNPTSYAEWVVQPAIPDTVTDIGTRTEPNLERIAALNPDLILAAAPQKDLVATLETIAPVLYLPNFRQSDNSAETAIRHFRLLATLLGKETLAEQKLEAMEQHLLSLQEKLETAYPHSMPSVVTMRFANTTSVFLYGENSTTQYVMNKLGLSSALPQPASDWGISQQRLTRLQHIDNGYVLYFLPFPEQKKLEQSILWRAMPFVRKHHVNAVAPVWNYGGAMSIGYIADALTDSLLAIAPTQ